MEKQKTPLLQFRLSTLLFVLVIVGLVVNSVVTRRAYEFQIQQLTLEAELARTEISFNAKQLTMGPMHPEMKALKRKREELQKAVGSNDKDSN